jgi:hypothetical protein
MGTVIWGESGHPVKPALCRDSKLEGRKLLESGGTDGSFQRPEERSGTLIAPLSHPRPLPCKPLPNTKSLDGTYRISC